MLPPPPRSTLFPYTTLFRSNQHTGKTHHKKSKAREIPSNLTSRSSARRTRSEEHTSELQSLTNLVCRLPLEKKNKTGRWQPPASTARWDSRATQRRARHTQ